MCLGEFFVLRHQKLEIPAGALCLPTPYKIMSWGRKLKTTSKDGPRILWRSALCGLRNHPGATLLGKTKCPVLLTNSSQNETRGSHRRENCLIIGPNYTLVPRS